MKFPSAEDLVIDFLATRTTVRVVTAIPSTRPDSFVQVRRTGGVAINRVVDRPQLTITAWAKTETEAENTANACREALLSEHAEMTLVRGVSQTGGLYYNPDPDTGLPRYTFTVSMTVRGTR